MITEFNKYINKENILVLKSKRDLYFLFLINNVEVYTDDDIVDDFIQVSSNPYYQFVDGEITFLEELNNDIKLKNFDSYEFLSPEETYKKYTEEMGEIYSNLNKEIEYSNVLDVVKTYGLDVMKILNSIYEFNKRKNVKKFKI